MDDYFNVYGGSEAAYIADMPDTRDVGTVKVGQFARTSACDFDVPVRLKVFEAPSTAIEPSEAVSQSMDGTGSLDDTVVTTTFANLTFHMRPFTMRQGYSYTFTLYTPSSCATIARRYWPHNQSAVNGGAASECTKVPNGYGEYRIWHVHGAEDLPSCSLITPGNFDSTMPTGWLVVEDGYWGQTIETSVHENPGTPDACTLDWESEYVTWRPYPANPDYFTEYACMFTGFSSPGSDLTDGWYYAGRWDNMSAPSDPYLELDPNDPTALLDTYEPVYAFDSGENFFPQKASAFTDTSASIDPYVLADANQLHSGSTVLAASSSPGTGTLPPPLTLDTLGPTYNLGTSSHPAASSSDYIDAHGTDEPTAHDDSELARAQGNGDVVYGRFVQDPIDHKLWLQYWTFYYYNSFSYLGIGTHEGDWEMTQIGLDDNLTPTNMTFSIHDGPGRSCYWSDLLREGDDYTRAVVFPGAGSHASYPDMDLSNVPVGGVDTTAWDSHLGDGVVKDSLPVEVANGERWWDWPGRWGADDGSGPFAASSPVSPSQQGDKWSHPSAFDANSDHDDCAAG